MLPDRWLRALAWFIFALMIAFYGSGCSTTYPGAGQDVHVAGQGEWTHNADDVEALREAMALWNGVGARFVLDDPSGSDPYLPVHVEPLPWFARPWLPSDAIGCYWENDGEVWVDSRYVSAPHGLLMQSLAHELGHAIGLGHDAGGIMGANGTTATTLSPYDVAEYRARWGTP